MGYLEIFLTGIALSMDAFAVSVGKGLTLKKATLPKILCVGLWFGGFQALMPLGGYFLGESFASYVEAFDHWIAFGLLALIGGNMIRESLKDGDEGHDGSDFGLRTMLLLAIATSIDAFAAGVSFAFMDVAIWGAVAIIGLTTFIFSGAGLCLGEVVGSRFHKVAGIAGGIVLIGIGLKVLLEHLLA